MFRNSCNTSDRNSRNISFYFKHQIVLRNVDRPELVLRNVGLTRTAQELTSILIKSTKL